MLIFVVIEMIKMIKMKMFIFILNVHFNSSKEKNSISGIEIFHYDVPKEFSPFILLSISTNFF